MIEGITNRAISVGQLTPHPRNYRQHPQEQITDLVASHQRFGQFRSVIVWQRSDSSYTIVAGHGIVEAMKTDGVTEIRADVLPPETPQDVIDGIMIADNELSMKAEDDTLALATLLEEQKNAGYDLRSLGTDEESLQSLLDGLSNDLLGKSEDGDGGDEFDTTPQDGPTRSQVGQIWQLGEHRLFVGDCSDQENVALLMGGELADCCWTDPPYGVSYIGKTKDALTIKNDGKEDLDVFLTRAFLAIDTALAGGAAIYICHPAGVLCLTFGRRIVEQGWRFHETLIWVKDSMVLGHSDYHFRHEPIYLGYKPGTGRYGRGGKGWYGDDSQKSVFEVPRPKRSTEHPTMKPIELIQIMLKNSVPPGGLVYEPFAGSGSTLIAAHRLGMRTYNCEIDPKYADVLLNRFTAETGIEATLLSDERKAIA